MNDVVIVEVGTDEAYGSSVKQENKSHPLRRADFSSVLEFAEAVRAWHLAHPAPETPVEIRRRLAREKRADERYQAAELQRERYAESQTIYGFSELLG